MGKLEDRRRYVEAFRAASTQLNDYTIAGHWHEMGIRAEDAAEWSNAGFLPAEALPLIAQGMTPELAAIGDDALVDSVGLIEAARLKLAAEGGEVVVSPWIEESMEYKVIRTQLGELDYETYLRPILRDPEPEIWADAEIDMRSAEDRHKVWWLAIKDRAVIAWCAIWPLGDLIHDGAYECGHNYERRGLGRQIGAYQGVFAARQSWIREREYPCVTWVFDQPVAPHEATGWQLTGEQGVSDDGHHWQQLTWRSNN